jgi:predicted ATPase
MQPLDSISITGFKSIQTLSALTLRSLNILIGSNGSGKSNFISFFRTLESMARGSLQDFIRISGGAETMCFSGRPKLGNISSELTFGVNKYKFTLTPSLSEGLLVTDEQTWSASQGWLRFPGGMREEARLHDWRGDKGISGLTGARNVCGHIHDAVGSWRVYHFHDTSENAPLRRAGIIGGDKRLLQDGSNLAPFLLYLKQRHEATYQRIVETIQVVAPFFLDFSLEAESSGPDGREICRLRWQQKGVERLMQPWQFSDGTLRFIALTAALMQPMPPGTILIDEPELGLHPRALAIFRGLLHEASNRMQIIVTTQSSALLDSMEPEDIIIVSRESGASAFHRLERAELNGWLSDYTLEELWRKNVIQAGPDYE